MNLQPLLARLTAHERRIAGTTEQLGEHIAELASRLREADEELEHLRITRKTILDLPDEDTPRPPDPGPPVLPEHPDYQRILDVFVSGRGKLALARVP